jgi:hypothetical protein
VIGPPTPGVAPQLPLLQQLDLQPTTADKRIAPDSHKKRLEFLILDILSV